jgi:oligopeptide transport system substrate-binding protein
MSRVPRFRCAAAVALALVLGPATAAVIPPGVQLHATQTLVRNNGSEPETLDPALA